MPDWKQYIRERLAHLPLDPQREEEIVEELAHYFEDLQADPRAGLQTEEEAIAAALAEIGDGQSLAKEIQSALRAPLPRRIAAARPGRSEFVSSIGEGSTNMLSDFWLDVRYGIRMLANRPGFTIAAVLILALGIGANTAVFTFMNSLFLRPLTVPDPERVVRLYGSGQDVRRFDAFSYANYRDLRDRSRSFEALAAHQHAAAGLSLGGDTENAYGELVTGNYFSAMRVQPVLGRVFTPEDDQKPGGHPVVVISHEMWKRRFGSVPDILGKIIHLNGHAFTVVGVMPERFKGSYGALAAEFWAPMMMYE